MTAADKIAEALAALEELANMPLGISLADWSRLSSPILEALREQAPADLADAQAQEIVRLRGQLTRERAEGIREGWRKAASYHEGLAKSLKDGVPENYDTNIGIEHHKSSAALFRTAANLTPDVISPTPSPETAP